MNHVHLLLHNELKFNTRLVKILSLDSFADEHNIFVTNHEKVYSELKGYGVLFEKKSIHELINKYAADNDYVFIHDLRKPLEILKVKKKYLNKIVWRTWGSDIGFITKLGDNFIVKVIKRFMTRSIRFRIRGFKLIGIANTVDVVSLKKAFGKIPDTICIPYTNPDINTYSTLKRIREEPIIMDHNDTNVLIEHSGHDHTHVEIMNILQKFKSNQIHLFVVLSYGKEEYINRVKEYAEIHWKDKCTIITDFMDYDKYARLLSQMDIGIFAQKNSYALGNISILSFFGKKFYFNRNGVLKEAFDIENIPCYCIDQIEQMSFDEFIMPTTYPKECGKTILPQDSTVIERWEDVFTYLNSK